MRKLVLATKNPGKAREMAEALAGVPYEIVCLADYPNAPDIEETGSTFAENAILKATAYAEFTGELTLADDSGLEVDALDGAPGVFSSRFASTDAERNAKLLELMKDVANDRRTARFRCVIAIATPPLTNAGHMVVPPCCGGAGGGPKPCEHTTLPPRCGGARGGPKPCEHTTLPPLTKGGPGGVQTCEGTIEGIIAREPKGTNGFGYDPIFYLPSLGKHMAELSPSEKNAISHRGKALEKAKRILCCLSCE